MLFHRLVETSQQVGATRARNAKVEHLAGLLRELAPAEIEPAVAFLSGRLRQGKIGLGHAAVRDARPAAVAAEPSLGLAEVDATFERIATESGPGSVRRRGEALHALLSRATEPERDFLLRLIVGELRQGALEGLMAESLARAGDVSARDVRRALMLAGDLVAVARAALTEGSEGLARFRLELFRPLQPMLAQPADNLGAALERLGEAALEYKLDGARVQVHKDGDEVRVFSRRLNDVTAAVPELVEQVRALPARVLLLDGEVLALRDDGSPQPFQVTMRRFGRRLDVDAARAKLPLTPFFFDVLRVDDDELMDRPGHERFAALRAIVPGHVVPALQTADVAAAGAFFSAALDAGHEGIMAKSPDARYAAGSRGASWLKVKPAHTLDLVVLAVEHGSGRRQGFLSNIHLGARDPATGSFAMLGKTFKGMTDEMLAWQTKRFRELEIATDGYVVHVRPEQVVEIAFSDVQQSPQYPAGLALRFARVKRYRDDKAAAQADTIDTVRALLDRKPGQQGGKPS